MLDYKTCKKLKEVGFPQFELEEKDRYGENHIIFRGRQRDSRFVLIPTLEELIEACGKNIILEQRGDGFAALNRIQKKIAIGKTPSEAVANLWLRLNE